MKTLLAAAVTLALFAPAVPAMERGIPAAVYLAHDKFPGEHRGWSKQDEKDCDNCSCLAPDGDHDCDDGGTKGVPEPGTVGLLAVGLGGLMLARRRRR